MDEPLRPELQAAIEALENKWNEYFYTNERDGPDTLYHYTSAAGFDGIVSTMKLWASSVSFMNDPSEIKYGLRLLATIFEEQQNKIPIYGAFTKPTLLGLEDTFRIFICCFCEAADVGSQWDGYGYHGTGVSIGVRKSELLTLAGEPKSYVMFPLIYDVNKQREIAMAVIAQAFDTVERLKLRDEEWWIWWQEIGIQLLTFVLRFKNPEFQREREWRILKLQRTDDSDASPMKFRGREQVKIPYIELPLTPRSIAEVIEGPRSTVGRKAIIRAALDSHGLERTDVRCSQCR